MSVFRGDTFAVQDALRARSVRRWSSIWTILGAALVIAWLVWPLIETSYPARVVNTFMYQMNEALRWVP